MKKTVLPVLVVTAILSAGVVIASDGDHREARDLVASGSILPLERILDAVHEFQPGKVLEVELEKDDGLYLYEIEVLDTNGEVWEMKVDAVSGKLLETERED